MFAPLQHHGETCDQTCSILTLITTLPNTILTQALQDHEHVSFKTVLGHSQKEPETKVVIICDKVECSIAEVLRN